ncbi:hypothetical protein D3C80_2068880 [compost metagenome]
MNQIVAIVTRLYEAAERQHQLSTLDALADQLFAAYGDTGMVRGRDRAQVGAVEGQEALRQVVRRAGLTGP